VTHPSLPVAVPLDLKAIKAMWTCDCERRKSKLPLGTGRMVTGHFHGCSTQTDGGKTIARLLAALRETREALKECRDILDKANLANRVLWLDGVLAEVRDE